MREPKLLVSERELHRMFKVRAERAYDGEPAAELIQEVILDAYLGEESIMYDEGAEEYWAQLRRIGKVDRVLHDRLGLMLVHAVSRYLRRRIKAREAVLEARRRRYAARKAS